MNPSSPPSSSQPPAAVLSDEDFVRQTYHDARHTYNAFSEYHYIMIGVAGQAIYAGVSISEEDAWEDAARNLRRQNTIEFVKQAYPDAKWEMTGDGYGYLIASHAEYPNPKSKNDTWPLSDENGSDTIEEAWSSAAEKIRGKQAEQFVLSIIPDAFCQWRRMFNGFYIYSGQSGNVILSGGKRTQGEAWQDAAARLRQQQQEKDEGNE